MHEALTGLLERAELAVAASRGVVHEATLARVSDVVAAARARLQYPEEVTVAVLVGGTGSGKSSLFNALTGEDHAEIGTTRPVTATPLAGVPPRHAAAIGRFLDDLGVERRVEQDRLPGVCLIDLPDTDSVETDHRHTVEQIMPRVDVMIWVVDPEKYRDAALHHRYLTGLKPYRRQLVIALNQIDRLSPVALGRVVADLEVALVEDGIGGVPIVATAAHPAVGPRIGVDTLAGSLRAMASDRPPLYGKLLSDLVEMSSELEARIGPPTAFRDRSGEAAREAAAALASGDLEGAVSIIVGFSGSLAEEVDGPISEEILGYAAGVPAMVHEVGASLVTEERRARWWRPARRAEPDPTDPTLEAVMQMLAPLRETMTRRAVAAAAITDLALSARSVAVRSQPVT